MHENYNNGIIFLRGDIVLKHKIKLIFICLLFTISSSIYNINPITVNAQCSTVDECEQKLKDLAIQKQRKQEEIERYKNESTQLENKIWKISENLQAIDDQINVLKNYISELEKKIDELTESLKKKDEIVKRRMEKMQLFWKTNPFLEFLANANSITDFVRRIAAVEQITSADREILKEIKAEREQKKELMSKNQESLDKQEALKKETNQLIEELKETKRQIGNKMAQAHKEEKAIFGSEEEVLEQLNIVNNALKDGRLPQDGAISLPTSCGYVNAEFKDPAYKQQFGWEHIGTDVTCYRGTGTKIKAVASGVVIGVRKGGSVFGNSILVYSRINGQDYVFMYGHMSSILPSMQKDKIVYAGQQLGWMGNTGISFGNHLHLEVYKGIKTVIPESRKWERERYAINSRQIIRYPWSW